MEEKKPGFWSKLLFEEEKKENHENVNQNAVSNQEEEKVNEVVLMVPDYSYEFQNDSFDPKLLHTSIEVYEEYGISDLSQSVFKIDEFSKALPEMEQSIKKQTVISILNASNLNVDRLISDGENRIRLLNSSCENSVNDLSNSILSLEEKRKELLQQLEEVDDLTKTLKSTIVKQKELTKEEVDKIEKIIQFIQ